MAQGNNHQSNIGAGMTREQQIMQYNQHLAEQRRLQIAALAGSNNLPHVPQQAPNMAQVQYMQQQIMQQRPVGNPNVGGRNRPSSLSSQQQARYMSQIQRQRPVSNSGLGRVNGVNGTPRQHAASPFQQHVSFGLPEEPSFQSQQQYGDDQMQSLQLEQHIQSHHLQTQQNSQSQAQFNGYNHIGTSQQQQQQQQQQQLARSRTYQTQFQHAQASAAMNSPRINSLAGALTPPNDATEQPDHYGHPQPQQIQADATPIATMTQPMYITPPSNSPQRSHTSPPAQQYLQGQRHARTVSLSNMKDANEALRRVNNVSSYGPPIQDKVQQQLLQDRLRANARSKANANAAARTNGNQQSPYNTPRPGTPQPPQQQPQQQPHQQQTQQMGSPGTKRKHQEDDPSEQQAIMDARRKQLESERQLQQQQAIRARQNEEYHRQQEAMRKRQEEERQQRAQAEAAQRRQQEQYAAEHRERVRIAEEQRLERERKAIRKQQLKKDRSSLYRYYDEYLEHFPLGVTERRNQYLNNLLANRRMPEDRNSDLGLAIQYAKDHWEFFVEYNSKTVKECAEDQRKVLEGRGEKVPPPREEGR